MRDIEGSERSVYDRFSLRAVIAGLRYHLVFDFLALLIDDVKRHALVVDYFHFQLTELTVFGYVRRHKAERVLIAQQRGDVLKNARHLAIEKREEGAAAGIGGKGLQGVVRLQEVHTLDGSHRTARVSPFAHDLTDADEVERRLPFLHATYG